jgi:nucleoside phosphorylase
MDKAGLRVVPNPNPLPINPKILGRLLQLQVDRRHLDELRSQWQAGPPNTVLNVHIGPLFSSPTVIAADDSVRAIEQHWRKLIGLEMEAHAVHRACNDTVDSQPLFLCLKSICDFADKDKTDSWQEYAAFTSANVFHYFLTTEWQHIT